MQLLVTGSTGRIGRMLRLVWVGADAPPLPMLWQGRKHDQDIDIPWDIAADPAPPLPQGLIVLHLAGRVAGSAAVLAENRLMTAALCHAARENLARHVFVMSSVAVYPPVAALIAEECPARPISPYGQSKLEAEQAAAKTLHGSATGLTLLRLANLAGADALLGQPADRTLTLDPIANQPRGPQRSYIGPHALARVLERLVALAAQGETLPRLLNLAQPPVVAMADLLDARGQVWHFGPARTAAVPSVGVATDRLAALLPLPTLTPSSLIADLNRLGGRWP